MAKLLALNSLRDPSFLDASRRVVLRGMVNVIGLARAVVSPAFFSPYVKIGVVLAKQRPFAQRADDLAKALMLALKAAFV